MLSYDFIAIYETWCEHECDLLTLEGKLDGYKCFSQCASRVSKHGRPSGGIAVYVKSKFVKCVNRIDDGYKFAVILELSNLLTTVHDTSIGSMLLVSVYLPPKNSTAYDDELEGISVLKEKLIELKSRFPNHKLLVMGDLNARIGTVQDFLVDDSTDYIDGLDWYAADSFNIAKT